MEDLPTNAPKGTFYFVCDEFDENYDFSEFDAYMFEKIGDRSRFAWYCDAEDCVYELQFCDETDDIEFADLSRLNSFFEAMHWVAQNDPKALEYCMSELCKKVYPVVKRVLVKNLEQLGYHIASVIVKNHLKTKAPDKVRDYQRRRNRVLSILTQYADDLRSRSRMLDNLRTNYPDSLHSHKPRLKQALGAVLNINKDECLYTFNEKLESLLWLYQADKDLLVHLFSDAVFIETKELFLKPFIQREEYELVALLNRSIPVIPSGHPYFNIPPYIHIDFDFC